MRPQRGAAFELRPLGSHVAVRDSPSPVRLTHCLTGVDYGHEDHQVRGQDLQLPRRRCFSGCCGRFATNGVASLPGLIRRRVWGGALAMVFELGLTGTQRAGRTDFACLPAGLSRSWLMALRLLWSVGMQWNRSSKRRSDRHPAFSAGCRSERALNLGCDAALEAGGETVVEALSGMAFF